MNGGRWFGGGSSEGEAELGKSIGPAAPLPALCVPAPARSEARAELLGRKKDAPELAEAGRGGLQPSHVSLMAQSPGLCPINAIASFSRPLQRRRRKTALSCYPGNRQRTPVAPATVRGLQSAFVGASGYPDNRYPFWSTISPSPVTLATVALPNIPWTRRPAPACRPPSPQPPPAHFQTPTGALLWSPPRAEAARSPGLSPLSHSRVGLSIRYRELFKMQAMSLPC